MRALLAALLLAVAAAVAAVPSASASPGLRVCTPTNPLDVGACAYGRGPDCLLIVINPPGPSWCTAPQQTPDVIVCQSYDCTSVRTLTDGAAVCVPPGSLSGACAGDVDQGVCAWYWLGPDFSSACVPDWLTVRACSNHLWDNDPDAGTECQDVL
jgi:hypothetical protein